MGLAEQQRLLAQLWTDSTLRGQFLRDPAGVAAMFDLDTAEAEALSSLGAGPLGEFAETLFRKRRNEVEKLLPATCRVLGPARLRLLFHRHANCYFPEGVKRHRNDALAFAAFLERKGRSGLAEPRWLLDLLHLESDALAATDPAFHLSVWISRYHPADLLALASRAEGSPDPPIRPTLIFRVRPTSRARLRTLILPSPIQLKPRNSH